MQEQHNNIPNLETRITNLEQQFQKLETLILKNQGNENISTDISIPQNEEGGLNFNLDIRAFVKRYVAGKKKKSGPQKFVFLLAYMSQGNMDKDIEVKEIKKKWDKMKSKELLGIPFDAKTATRAKTNGWVRSRKHGSYHLTKSWIEVL